jgi:hypothetical protein
MSGDDLLRSELRRIAPVAPGFDRSPPSAAPVWLRVFMERLTDNYLTGVNGLNSLHGADGKFLVLPIAGPF